jgi:hypothetical protein
MMRQSVIKIKKDDMRFPLYFMLCAVTNVAFSTMALAADNGDAKADFIAMKSKAATQYKINRAKCDALVGNPKEVCVAQAKADQTHTNAEADAVYKGSEKARAAARKEIANADYDVATTRCKSLTGNDKEVCIKEAKSTRIGALADAKADLKVSGIRKEAAEDKKDAEYDVAKEKCDGLAGAAKEGCLKQIKARFSK